MKATIVVARGTKMGRLYLTNSCVDLEAVEEAKTNPYCGQQVGTKG